MPKDKTAIPGGELGGAGTTIYGGVVSGAEYNASLSTDYGGNGLRVYDKMRRSDPVVRAALFIIKLAILQAEWAVQTEDKSAKGEEIRSFYEEALFNRMNRSFYETLSDILTYLPFGFFVAEKVYKVEDGRVWWEKFAYRSQASIKSFETKDKQNGVTQVIQGDRTPQEVSIPIDKLLIFTNEKEGDNWRGQSLLRSAYKPYFFKEQVEKIDAIGFEREAVGIPVFIMPKNPKPEDEQKADTIGENLRAHEKAYVKLPFEWQFDVKYPTGSRRDADVALKRWNREILVSVLTQFLDLGSTDSGSRALSTDHTEVFYRSIQAIADYIAAIINQHGGRKLIDLNFDGVTTYPSLTATGIEKIDLQKFGDALSKVVSAHVVLPDDELEDYIRKVFRLPEKTTPRKPILPEVTPFGDKDNGQDNGKQNSKQPPKKVEAKDRKQGKRFSAFEPFRPLYFAEQKVNYLSLQRQIDRLEQEINRELPQVLQNEIEGLVTAARFALQSGDTKRVEDLRIQFKDQVRLKIQDKLKSAYELGKVSASNEMDIDAPKTSDDVIDYLVTQANILADKLTLGLLSDAKLQVMAQIQQDAPADTALTSLKDELTTSMLSQMSTSGNFVHKSSG